MKLTILCATLVFAALPKAAHASEADCFPLCVQAAPSKATADPARTAGAANDDRDLPGDAATQAGCDAGLIKQAEDLNEKIRPLREIAGYVRSPQGLVIKMIDDHVVKIPVWVGYAVDPLGSIRHKATEALRSRTRNALNDGNDCKAGVAGAAGTAAESAAESAAQSAAEKNAI